VTLYVGTSGWAYPEWKGTFYPPRLPQSRFLEHYAQTLTSCEVNATFYRVQAPKAMKAWAGAVPASFRFTVKGHRRLTYRKQLVPNDAERTFVAEFVDSLTPLGEQLGCLMLQLPPFIERDDAGLDSLLELLPPDLRFSCEFQHESWWTSAVADRLAERGGTICLREERAECPPALPPGPLAYLRLKGMHYAEPERAALKELLHTEAEQRDVYVFARHKEVPADDPHTGLGLARWLTGD
jgi:uncharacterized protein YecE (DUF72 family)